MSMIGNYFMTDQETIDRIQKGELQVADLIYDEDDNVDEEASLDIDKAWNAIHYVLTGEADLGKNTGPLSKAVLGGTPVSEEDVGYGPALLIEAEEVRQIARLLQPMGREAFQERFRFAEMLENEVYPMIPNEDEEGFFEYIWDYFAAVKEFFAEAAAQGKCILFYIN